MSGMQKIHRQAANCIINNNFCFKRYHTFSMSFCSNLKKKKTDQLRKIRNKKIHKLKIIN